MKSNTPAKKSAGGRPAHAPTPEQRNMAKAMAGWGVPQEHIANALRIDKKTLHKYYREELDEGLAKAIANVSKNLYTMATGSGKEALTAAIFYLKCRAGWKPPAELEIVNNVTTGESNLDPATEAKVKAWAADIEKTVQQKAKHK